MMAILDIERCIIVRIDHLSNGNVECVCSYSKNLLPLKIKNALTFKCQLDRIYVFLYPYIDHEVNFKPNL